MMSVYAALLRGINVGGNHRVNMGVLKKTMEEAGYTDVQTYIQSGNVLFKSNFPEDGLAVALEELLEKRFGFPMPVILRTARQLQEILDHVPYTAEEIEAAQTKSGVESLHIILLNTPPTEKALEKAKALPECEDRFNVRERDIYLLLENGVHRSIMAERLSKISEAATMRNINTMKILAQMANDPKWQQ